MLLRPTLKNPIKNLNFVKGINHLLLFSSYLMLKNLRQAIILAINHHDRILNSFSIIKLVNKRKKKKNALLDHKYSAA